MTTGGGFGKSMPISTPVDPKQVAKKLSKQPWVDVRKSDQQETDGLELELGMRQEAVWNPAIENQDWAGTNSESANLEQDAGGSPSGFVQIKGKTS